MHTHGQYAATAYKKIQLRLKQITTSRYNYHIVSVFKQYYNNKFTLSDLFCFFKPPEIYHVGFLKIISRDVEHVARKAPSCCVQHNGRLSTHAI